MVDLNINLVAKMAGAGAGGAAGGVAGAAGAGLAGRAGGAMAAGLMGGAGGRTEMIGKGLGQISKQLPGAGMLGDMAGAFKSGGIVGVGMAGVAGIMGFVKQIMESSKVFQGIAGSFFKIFGAMADVFLLPFLPLAMKGMQLLMRYLPNFSRWGQSAADGVENIIKTFKDKGFWGAIGHYLTEAWQFISEDVTTWVKDVLMPALANAVMHLGGAVGNAMKAAIEGKEKVGTFGAEGSPTGESEIIQQKTGRFDVRKGSFYTRSIERLGKSAINVGTNALFGGQGTNLQWSPSELESVSGNVSEEDLERMAMRIAAGSTAEIEMQRWREGGYGEGDYGTKKQLGGFVRSYQTGGFVHGGPGEGVPTMLHGGEIIIPRSNVQSLKGINSGVVDILAGTDGQLQALEADINNYWMESKRARQDPQSDFMKFKLEVIGEDLPNTLSTVGGWYTDLGNTANTIANQTKGFGAGWTASGLAAFKKYGVKPMTPAEIAAGLGDNDTLDPNAIEAGWIPPDLKPDKVKNWLGENKVVVSNQLVNQQFVNAGQTQVGNADRIKAAADTYMKRDIDTGEVIPMTSQEIDTIFRQKHPEWYDSKYSLDSKEGVEGADMEEIYSSQDDDLQAILAKQAARIATSRIQQAGNLDETEDTVYAEQVRQAYAERIAKRQLELQQEQLKRDNEEKERMEDSLQKANEAIYGPEGGISATGTFEHGGLLAERTDLSKAMRMKTLDEMDLTEQQRADLGADYQIQAAPTAAPRPDAETMALAGMMINQQKLIDSYDPRIDAAWRWADAGGEGGKGQKQRGFKAQSLIREQSQQEEKLTRMMDQQAQDRLPYSLQEFQTRFPDEFAAGGIVPGDIGEPQMVMAHGGEQVSPVGMSGGRQGHTSNRVMNISINNASSVRDILRDLNDMESMDDASFFNSVT